MNRYNSRGEIDPHGMFCLYSDVQEYVFDANNYYTIYGDIPSKKNSKQILTRWIAGKKVPFISSSDRFKIWRVEQNLKYQMATNSATHISFDAQVIVLLKFFYKDEKQKDLTNGAESIMDFLVENKIIKDDKWKIVPTVIITGELCIGNPRCEIYIKRKLNVRKL
jgi:hypothetical protein